MLSIILGDSMMNTSKKLNINETDIEILDDGILVKSTYFNKKKIAETFNQLSIAMDFIQNYSKEVIL